MGQQSVGLGGLLQEIETVTPTKCWCCLRDMDSGDWCGGCFFHVLPSAPDLRRWQRNYHWQFGMPCPLNESRPFQPGQVVLTDGRGFCHVNENVQVKLVRYVGPNQYGYGPAWEVESILGVTVHTRHSDGSNCTIIENRIKAVAPVDKPQVDGVSSERGPEKEKYAEETDPERERETEREREGDHPLGDCPGPGEIDAGPWG